MQSYFINNSIYRHSTITVQYHPFMTGINAGITSTYINKSHVLPHTEKDYIAASLIRQNYINHCKQLNAWKLAFK